MKIAQNRYIWVLENAINFDFFCSGINTIVFSGKNILNWLTIKGYPFHYVLEDLSSAEVYSNFYLIFYPNFRILKKSDTQIWSKFGSFGYFFLFFYPNFWVSKNLVSKFLDTQKFGWKNWKKISKTTKCWPNLSIRFFEYSKIWIKS